MVLSDPPHTPFEPYLGTRKGISKVTDGPIIKVSDFEVRWAGVVA